VAVVKVYSALDDGRKGRPKHVSILVVVNKQSTVRVASCWFIIIIIIIYIYYKIERVVGRAKDLSVLL